jgi:hypothetical protein
VHFVRYIDTFLKFKAEDTGYPGWMQISEDEDIIWGADKSLA